MTMALAAISTPQSRRRRSADYGGGGQRRPERYRQQDQESTPPGLCPLAEAGYEVRITFSQMSDDLIKLR